MTFKPVEFSPPEPERIVLDNGMVVYLLEDHELPLITMTATMRTGSWLDPADKVGLAALTGLVMRTGGGGGLSPERSMKNWSSLREKSASASAGNRGPRPSTC